MEYHLTGHAVNRLAERALLTKPNGKIDYDLAYNVFSKEIKGHDLTGNMRKCNTTSPLSHNRYFSTVRTERYSFDIVISFKAASNSTSINVIVLTAYNLAIKNFRTGEYEPTERIKLVDALKELDGAKTELTAKQ